jgi:hypothetical protein
MAPRFVLAKLAVPTRTQLVYADGSCQVRELVEIATCRERGPDAPSHAEGLALGSGLGTEAPATAGQRRRSNTVRPRGDIAPVWSRYSTAANHGNGFFEQRNFGIPGLRT